MSTPACVKQVPVVRRICLNYSLQASGVLLSLFIKVLVKHSLEKDMVDQAYMSYVLESNDEVDGQTIGFVSSYYNTHVHVQVYLSIGGRK